MGAALAKKLGMKPGTTVAVLGPPVGYATALGDLPAGVTFLPGTSRSAADVVHLFVASRRDLVKRLPVAIRRVKPGGRLWVSYPKASARRSDLSRDVVRAEAEAMGWPTVTQVAVDDLWSALRLRPAHEVGT